MSGSNDTPAGTAARIRSRYASAAAVVVTGGERLGIATALANRAAVAGTTSASTAPSRKCACQSSGRFRVISFTRPGFRPSSCASTRFSGGPDRFYQREMRKRGRPSGRESVISRCA